MTKQKKETKVKNLRIKPSTFARFGDLMPYGEDSDAFFNKLMDSYVAKPVKEEKEVEEEYVEIPLTPSQPQPIQQPIPQPLPQPMQQYTDLHKIKQTITPEIEGKIIKEPFFKQWNWKMIGIFIGAFLFLAYCLLVVFG